MYYGISTADLRLTILPSFPETKGKSLEEMDTIFGDQAILHAFEIEVHDLEDDRSSAEKLAVHEKETA